jgi:type I restriction enzyme S subunit
VIHDLVRGVSYSGSDASKTPAKGHLPLLRANNIGTTLNFENLVFVTTERVGTEQRLRRGDYLLALSSGSKNLVGKAAYVPDDYEAAFGAFCGVVRVMSPDLVPYVGLFLASSLYREAIAASSRGIGINNLKREAMNSLAFPLPPFEEQERIVAKVYELMVVCDQLEERLREGSLERSRLLEALLHEALTVG